MQEIPVESDNTCYDDQFKFQQIEFSVKKEVLSIEVSSFFEVQIQNLLIKFMTSYELSSFCPYIYIY